MALRLTDAPAAGLKPKAAPAPANTFVLPPAALLVPRAQTALAAGDMVAYRALFAEAADVADVHRRYQARVKLIEAGLAAEGSDPGRIAAIFAAIAREAVAILEEEPREPVLLNYAGIALYELGELVAAEKLFLGAQRLDPALPHLDGNLAAIKSRRRAGAPKPPLAAAITAAMRDLVPRAKRVAASARPAEGMRLSLCMIVKDEEAMLGRCLAAVCDHVDEIIVVDTGSTDRTVEIAEGFGATILHHEWTGDFAAARNVSFEAATGDWMFFLDADEVVVDGDGPRLRALAQKTWREAHYFIETNHTGDAADGTAVTHNALRVFRNRPEYRFEGRIHEQIAQHLPGFLPERLEVSDVRVEHFGYLGVVRDAKEKSRRNIELLERQVAEGDDTPFLHYNLGSEHAAAGNVDLALEHLSVAWEKTVAEGDLTRLQFVPSLAGRVIKAKRLTGHLDDAMEIAETALAVFPGFTDIVLEQAAVARERGDLEQARAYLEQCLELGDAPSRYSPTVGCGTYLPLLALAELHRLAGRLDEADACVRRCLAEHPSFPGLAEPYTAVRLAAGAAPADILDELREGGADLSPGPRFMVAAVLHEHGAMAEAEGELRVVVEAQPDSAPARLALAETLLAQARLDDAVDAVADVEEDSPWAPAVVRTTAFAALATGDHAQARTVLARPAASGLQDAERLVFEAWADAAAGAEPAASLPADSGPVLVTLLDALARLEAYEAFELLVARYDTVAGDWREQREDLALLLLRRGFADAAGDVWAGVCQLAGPDARALAGLAQVAFLSELDEDARIFAEDARTLDPDNPAARAVLDRLAAAA